jgi:molybdopterin-synthase adenylyltransferase
LITAPALLSGYDVALDGSDNFETRYQLNDACVKAGLPLVSGAVIKWEGQVLTVLPGKSACYRCHFPEPPDPNCVQSCSDAGVIGAAAGVVGTLQAVEAVKVVLGKGEVLADRRLHVDLKTMRFREVPVKRKKDCAACGSANSSR